MSVSHAVSRGFLKLIPTILQDVFGRLRWLRKSFSDDDNDL